MSDSPVPNLVLVGNTSPWGGLQYAVYGLPWFVLWDAVERSSQVMVKLLHRDLGSLAQVYWHCSVQDDLML